MASDVLIQPASSVFAATKSASNLITNKNDNNQPEQTDSFHQQQRSSNKYIGHVSRLRNAFTQYASTTAGEHRSRSHHPTETVRPRRTSLNPPVSLTSTAPASPTNVLDETFPCHRTESPPLITSALINQFERSRSLSNPRLLDSATTANDNAQTSVHTGRSAVLDDDTTIQEISTVTEDHTARFRLAKEFFQQQEGTTKISVTKQPN
ncbi:unnamed protein product, partial [Didymodactylos carnosus]